MAKLTFPFCPACNADCSEHLTETAETYEAWRFTCGAEILVMEAGVLDASEPCRDALEVAIRRINKNRAA